MRAATNSTRPPTSSIGVPVICSTDLARKRLDRRARELGLPQNDKYTLDPRGIYAGIAELPLAAVNQAVRGQGCETWSDVAMALEQAGIRIPIHTASEAPVVP